MTVTQLQIRNQELEKQAEGLAATISAMETGVPDAPELRSMGMRCFHLNDS